MSSRDEKRHKYSQMMLAHRQEWQRYAHNQTKLAINKDKSVVRVAFASTSSPEKAMKKIEAYHKGPAIKVWENVFKAVWLETGHAAAEFMHEYLTGKSVNVTTDLLTENTQELKIFVWKDPVVDTVLSLWDSRVDDKVMNGGFLDKIEGINSTTQDKIHSTIQEGVANGDSHYTIGQNIESHLDETWAKRGETISRTETNSAMNAATREDMKATAPDLWKTWSIAGNNTRLWHEEVDGESIPQDEMFIVDGEEMEGPGDDSASPGNVVNCECTQLAEEPPAGTPVSDEEQARVDEAALAEGTATEGFPEEGFKTVDELNAYMEKNGIAEMGWFNSYDQGVANDMVRALDSSMNDATRNWLPEKYQMIGNSLPPKDAPPGAFMWTSYGKGGKDMMISDYVDKESIKESILQARLSEFENGSHQSVAAYAKTQDEYLQMVVDHELGHSVSDNLVMTRWNKEYSTSKELLGAVSDYSQKDSKEGFAEMYSLYVNGRQDLIPQEYITIMDSMKLIK